MNIKYIMLYLDEIEEKLSQHNVIAADNMFDIIINYIESYNRYDYTSSLKNQYQKIRNDILSERLIEHNKKFENLSK